MYLDLGVSSSKSRSPTNLSGCHESPGVFILCFRIFSLLHSLPGCRLHAVPGHDSDNALLIVHREVGPAAFHTHTQLLIFAQTKLKAAFGQVVSQARRAEKKESAGRMGAVYSVWLLAWRQVHHFASSPSLPQKHPVWGHAAAAKREGDARTALWKPCVDPGRDIGEKKQISAGPLCVSPQASRGCRVWCGCGNALLLLFFLEE
ncbi:hypothetical protein QBC39DRAFT_20456 [Podospora conica]|nr:hypothetical protein QBC39DRAFT_20456 [Schizothecium conicum]